MRWPPVLDSFDDDGDDDGNEEDDDDDDDDEDDDEVFLPLSVSFAVLLGSLALSSDELAPVRLW